MAKILLVDDDDALRATLSDALAMDGFTVVTAADGPSGLALMSEELDAVLLDVMLPGFDGIEVCRRIRQRSDVPVIMLTGRDHTQDKVTGLEVGADDYVTKPFSTRELVSRLRAVTLRRRGVRRLVDQDREHMASLVPGQHATPSLGQSRRVLDGGSVQVDLSTGAVTVRGVAVEVERDELRILELLLANRGRVVTRSDLMVALWREATSERVALLDLQVRRLRQKLELEPSDPQLLVTIPGIGYRFAG